MSKIFHNIEVPIDEDLEEKIQWLMPEHGPYRILRKSVDARRAHQPHFVYSVEIAEKNETLPLSTFEISRLSQPPSEKPIIVGSGPAGLFAALRLVEHGIPCQLFERGSESSERMKKINQFWRYGQLDPNNNVCFGEGGAGLYSDGKLITRIKSPHIPYVLNRLVQFGAPEEIQWLSNPHVGSDRIRRIIPQIRKFLISQGCEIFFNSQITKILTNQQSVEGVQTIHGKKYFSPCVVIATGHSATDMLEHLQELNVQIEGKSFAVGLRIEHPQSVINQIQYREFAQHPRLGAANYKLAHHDHQSQIGVYSFCMCPGGYVLSSGTEIDGIACNGMSNYNRNSPFANAAIVVSVDHAHLFKTDTWGGMKWRREIEKKSYQSVIQKNGTKELPAQNLIDFMMGQNKRTVTRFSSPSGIKNVALKEILPEWLTLKLIEGLEKFNVSMKGFLSEEAHLYGIESRTSCPLRVTRDRETLQSPSYHGLFPAGEGAGYAGGITSAACDGVNIADKIFELTSPR